MGGVISGALIAVGATEAAASVAAAGASLAAATGVSAELIGATVAGTGIGAGLGGVEAAATGGNVLKGMEGGALGGAITGGVGSFAGGALGGTLGAAAPYVAGAGAGALGGVANAGVTGGNLGMGALTGGIGGLASAGMGAFGAGGAGTDGVTADAPTTSGAPAPTPGGVAPGTTLPSTASGGAPGGASAGVIGGDTYTPPALPANGYGVNPSAVEVSPLSQNGAIPTPAMPTPDVNSALGTSGGSIPTPAMPTPDVNSALGTSGGSSGTLLSTINSPNLPSPLGNPGATTDFSNALSPQQSIARTLGTTPGNVTSFQSPAPAGVSGGPMGTFGLTDQGTLPSAPASAGAGAGSSGGAPQAATPFTTKLAEDIGFTGDTASLVGKGLGALPAAGVMGAQMLMGQQQPKGYNQLMSQANQAQQEETTLLNEFNSGTLPAWAQQALQSSSASAKAAVRSRYAAMGQSGSDSEQQALAQIDMQTSVQGGQMLQQLLQSGMQEGQIAGGLYENLLNNNVKQDTALSSSMGNFASALAGGGGTTLKLSA